MSNIAVTGISRDCTLRGLGSYQLSVHSYLLLEDIDGFEERCQYSERQNFASLVSSHHGIRPFRRRPRQPKDDP